MCTRLSLVTWQQSAAEVEVVVEVEGVAPFLHLGARLKMFGWEGLLIVDNLLLHVLSGHIDCMREDHVGNCAWCKDTLACPSLVSWPGTVHRTLGAGAAC